MYLGYITLAALGWWVPKTLSGVCLETFFSICKVENHNMVVLFYMNSFQNVMVPFKVRFIYRGQESPTYASFTNFFASFAKCGFYHVPKSVLGLPIEVQFVTKTVVVKVILFQSVSFFRLGLPIIYTNLHIFYKRLFLKRNDIM